MKKCFVSMFFGIAMLAMLSSSASAGLYNPTEYSGSLPSSPTPFDVVANDAYFFAPGIGGTGGFALSMTGAVNSIFDGAPNVVGSTLVTNRPVTTTESLVNNGGGNYDLSIFLQAENGSTIWPTGFTVGGQPANAGGLFLGANAGGNPINFVNPAIVNSAFVDLYDTAGLPVTSFDITAFSIFSAGPDGDWLGSLGVSFGAGSANGSIGGFGLRVNYNSVPEPTSGLLVGLALTGIGLSRRRS